MARMGHDSPRAALIYQHATAGADRAIADALDAAAAEASKEDAAEGEEHQDGQEDDDGGAAGALVPVG
jgi:hypothetical protein